MYSNLDPVGFPFLDWQCFNGLKELNSSYNKLRDLYDWLPPPSLEKLDIRGNSFEILSPERSPMFDEKFNGRLVHFQTLKMDICKIRELAENLILPPNLNWWSLSYYALSSFIFTENIASRESLERLDLSNNNISHISVVASERKFHMNLEYIDLEENDSWDMSGDVLDEVFKQLGLTVEGTFDSGMGFYLRRIES